MAAGLRLNWLQMKKMKHDECVKEEMQSKIKEDLLQKTVKQLDATVFEIEKKLSEIVDFISNTVIVSTQSAVEVGRRILSKFKKRKKKDTNLLSN